jgi:hypothetical protein
VTFVYIYTYTHTLTLIDMGEQCLHTCVSMCVVVLLIVGIRIFFFVGLCSFPDYYKNYRCQTFLFVFLALL